MIKASLVCSRLSVRYASPLTSPGGVVVTQDFLDTLNLNGKTTVISTVTAIYDIGCFFGAIIAFMIGEKLGRKKSILLGTTVMSIGAIIQIASYGVPEMIVGR